MIWKKLSVYRTAVTIVILLSQLSTLSAENPDTQNIEDFLENFPPARRQPQGRDMLTAASTDFMLGPLKVNSTEDVNSNIKNSTQTTVTLEQSASTFIFNNRSRLLTEKPQGLVFTLSLRSNKDKDKEKQSSEEENTSSSSENNYSAAGDDIMSTTEVNDGAEADVNNFGALQNNTSKAYRILDRLKNLTNSKVKSTASNVGTNFGQKRIKEIKGKLKGYGRSDVKSSRIKSGNDFSKTTDRPEGNFTTTAESISQAVFIDTRQNKTLNSKAGGHIDHSLPNKPSSELLNTAASLNSNRAPAPIVLKAANLTNLRNSVANQTGPRPQESPNEEQVGYETRTIVTADQIGGNRPTKMPFHFTTSTIPPSTTTEFRPSINRYNKLYSPHNHIYAPTQDPVAAGHHEDLNVEDFQDFRVANLVFGSKVGSEVSTYSPETESSVKRPPSPTPSSPRSPPLSTRSPSPQPSYSSPKQRPPKPSPPQNNPPAPLPQSASSGVKNSHVRIVNNNNNNNDNLPFYKEPGGVFKEHKYNDNDGDTDDVSNQINERTPNVKYAPRGQSAQTPTSYKQNVPQYNQYQQPPPSPGPAYVTATQQPLYLQPVPAQPAYHPGYTYQPPVQVQHQHVPQHGNVPYPQHQQRQTPGTAYYQQPQPIPYYPVQQQGYNPATPPQGFVPVLPAQVYHQPQPIPAPPLQPVYTSNPPVNQYSNYNQPTPNIYKPPPRRHDPSTDDFYGDPLPTTKDSSKLSSSSSKPKRKKPVEEEEDEPEEDYSNRGDYEPARPPEPPKDYPKRGSSTGRNRHSNKDDDRERYRKNKDREDEDYDDEPPKPPPPPPRRFNNDDERRNRRPSYDDYDNPERNQYQLGDFAQPNNNNHQPLFNDPIPGPNADFVDLDSNFNRDNDRHNGVRQRRPFNPSPQDYGPIRPSRPDNSPNFDHPNIQYPDSRGSNQNNIRRPEYDPRGFGVGYGPPLRKNLPLDPIYTRTIKQFDEETIPKQRANENRGGSDRDREKEPEPDDHEEHGNDSPREEEEIEPQRDERPPPRRHNSRRNEEEEEEEDPREERQRRPNNKQEEEEEEEDPREERQRRPNNKQEEEEPEEEEEEEETQNKEITPEGRKANKQNSNKNEEEEEEEEEEEPEEKQPKRRHQERKNQEPKKPPPKKPKHEKSGNLDEDIIGIEREFGGYFDPRGGQATPPPINGGFNG